jgi:hydroxymethylbilane synthase
LALAQCRQFLARLVARHPHVEVEELHVVTTGDKILDRPLAEIGGKGLFLKEIEDRLLDGQADIAVHSMKDVPPQVHEGLVIGCIPVREDPRDVVITRDGRLFSELAQGASVGTSSLRRAVQLLLLRPDLRILPIRGNVGTRIRKCKDGEVDATVLALAGLNRLGLAHEVSEVFSTETCLPAVGQGALAIELRAGDHELGALLGSMQDEETALCITAERGVMTAIEGSCTTPVAAFAERQGDQLRLRALLAQPDGSRLVREESLSLFPGDAGAAFELGMGLGAKLRAQARALGGA